MQMLLAAAAKAPAAAYLRLLEGLVDTSSSSSSSAWAAVLRSAGAVRQLTCSPHQQQQQQQQPEVACLSSSRSLLRVHGPQALEFLQGMVTNDMRPLEHPGCPPVYAALLTAKGKVLHDVIVYREEGAAGSVLMEADAQGAEQLQALLKRYTMKRKVSVEAASSQYTVWAAYGVAVQQGTEPPPAIPGTSGRWHRDPRLPALGWRAVAGAGVAPPAAGSERGYVRWRCLHGVAEGRQEIPPDEAGPFEYSLDTLHGISYTKGCYVGQERVSFGHYRGITRRRCMPFRVLGTVAEGVILPDAEVSVQDAAGGGGGKVVGSVRVCAGDVGLAVLKLSAALPAAEGQLALAVATAAGPVALQPFKPSWWSPEWGREE